MGPDAGERLSRGAALALYTQAPTQVLGRLADAARARRHPDRVVTYIIDRNVNYTNVCVARCNFCAFYRPVGSADGYVLGFDEIFTQDRRDHQRRRRSAAAAGRAQPGPADRLVRRSLSRGEGPIPGLQAARAVAARGAAHLAHGAAAGARRHRAAHRGRPRQHSRRRRRDPRRSRAQAAALLRQGDRRRVAGRDARGAPGRTSHDRDDDVRHGRDARGAPRAHAPAARLAGRDRRLHRVHHLELPARSHRAWPRARHHARSDRRGLPAHAGASHGSCSTTSTTSSPRGSRRAARWGS